MLLHQKEERAASMEAQQQINRKVAQIAQTAREIEAGAALITKLRKELKDASR